MHQTKHFMDIGSDKQDIEKIQVNYFNCMPELHKIFNFLGPQCLSKYFLQVMARDSLQKVTFLFIISDFLN